VAPAALTFEPGYEANPVWSPDGERIVYTSNRDGLFRCYIRSAKRMGAEQLVERTGHRSGHAHRLVPGRSAPDPAEIRTANWDILGTDPCGRRTRGPARSAVQRTVRAPVAGWSLAGSTSRTRVAGTRSTCARPMAAQGAGRCRPRRADAAVARGWTRDLLRRPRGQITAVAFSAAGSVEIGDPVQLFRMPLIESTYVGQRFVVSADGQRDLRQYSGGERAASADHVVTNFAAELGRK
jgi:hypothetical protein